MTTVRNDVVVHMTVEIDADELIDECARDIVDSRLGSIGGYGTEVHDVDITAE